jgi:hypothetical protein
MRQYRYQRLRRRAKRPRCKIDATPEGLAFTAQGPPIVGLDARKPRRNLVLLEPEVAEVRGRD